MAKNLYAQVRFDSDLERGGALTLDTANEIAWSVRLHGDDVAIIWNDAQSYEPDFLAYDPSLGPLLRIRS